MKKRYLLIIGIVALGAGVFTALMYRQQTQSLKAALQESRQAEARMAAELAAFGTSLHIDSLLAEGHFREALEEQEQLSAETGEWGATGIQLRMAVISDLLRQRDRLQAELQANNAEQETEELSIDPVQHMATRQIDSLSFALEKTQLELTSLHHKLREKSFGEFLTFRSEKGTLMYYVGEVKNGKANGFGIALLETGSRYKGTWKNNKRHGEGSFYWPDGQYYIGQYENDHRNGNGAYYWPNGEKYVGDWENDRRNGEGIFYDKGDQVMASGTWKDDKLVEER